MRFITLAFKLFIMENTNQQCSVLSSLDNQSTQERKKILCFKEISLFKNMMEVVVIDIVKSQLCQLRNWSSRLIFVEVVLFYYQFAINYEAHVSY